MHPVIYGDVYFLINFSMDYLSLFLLAKLLHLKEKSGRMAASAAVGALGATGSLLIPGTVLPTLVTFFLPMAMVPIAFGRTPLLTFFKRYALLFGVSFAMGGVMTAVYYLVGNLVTARKIVIGERVDTLYGALPGWVLALAAGLAALFAFLFSRFAKRSAETKTARVTVIDEGREVSFTALCDSGNLLTEPFGGTPVIVAGEAVFAALLSGERMAFLTSGKVPAAAGCGSVREGKEADAFKDAKGAAAKGAAAKVAAEEGAFRKFRFIPAATVSGTDLLRGYLPDAVLVDGVRKTACLALDKSGRSFGDCDAILPPGLLE